MRLNRAKLSRKGKNERETSRDKDSIAVVKNESVLSRPAMNNIKPKKP